MANHILESVVYYFPPVLAKRKAIPFSELTDCVLDGGANEGCGGKGNVRVNILGN